MSIDIRRHGKYQVYDTTQRYHMLSLDDRDYYVWRETPIGPMLELSDPGHEAAEILHQGNYLLLVTYNKQNLEDGVPYLFLQEDLQYRAYRLADNLPVEAHILKPIEETKYKYTYDELVHIIGVL